MATAKIGGAIRYALRSKLALLTLRPPKSRRGLLSNTALAGGALVAFGALMALPRTSMAQELTAACTNNPGNSYECHGPDDPANTGIVLEPTADYRVNLGADITNPEAWDGSSPNAAVTVNSGGHSTVANSYGIQLNSNSYLNNIGGEGLYVFDVGDVVINVNGAASESDDAASIVGTGFTNAGIHVDGQSFDNESEGLGNWGSSVVVNVNGHVEGTGYGSFGIHITNVEKATVNSHSYQSVMGGDGDFIHDVGQVVVDNSTGLTAGLDGSGLYIADITNAVPDSWAVDITNTEGGVIVGSNSGIYINGVGTSGEGDADVSIQNQGSYKIVNDEVVWTAGGLIAGMSYDGIGAFNVEGDLAIDNRFTRMGTINFSDLDSQVYGSEGDLLGMSGSPTLPSSSFTTGIFGQDNGISGSNIWGTVDVYNRDGQIVGESGNGIALEGVGGGVYVDNSAGWADMSESAPWVDGGTIWGAENGIYINGVQGDLPPFGMAVAINNFNGSIFGGDNGISISESYDDVLIGNSGGLVQGFWGDGIDISTVSGSESGAYVLNGGSFYNNGSESLSQEGWIVGADTAVNIRSTYAVVSNDLGGVIVGDGQSDEPVIRILTGNETFNVGSGPEFGEGGGTVLEQTLRANAVISNDGIMTSHNNPFVDEDFWPFPDTNELPGLNINTQAIIADVNDIVQFAYTGGASGFIDDLSNSGSIEDYWQTSSDLLLVTEGGGATLLNGTHLSANINSEIGDIRTVVGSEGASGGIMFGRVIMNGTSDHTYIDTSEGDFDRNYPVGNYVLNLGTWFTTNEDGMENREYGNIVYGDYYGEIDNGGVIQTAMGEGGDYTTFVVDEFFNGVGGDWLRFDNQIGEGGGRGFDGLLSMTDGDPLDTTVIYGDYYGQEVGDTSYRAYLAVDVNFAPISEGGQSDILQIGGASEGDWASVYGTTGIIVHKLNDGPDALTQVGDRIPVVYAYTDADGTCMDVWCRDGDDFFVSELSPNYVNVGGVGFIRDGMFMWGLQQRDLAPDPETDWVATWGPDAHDQPVLTSTMQTAWYDTSGYVEDHVYGNEYPQHGGGGGADLPSSDSSISPPTAASTQQSSLWGRISGNWSQRDTSVQETTPPLTFDTGLNQNTYNITAGVEFRPQGGDSETRLGLFGGYLQSNVTFDSYGATSKSSGGLVGGYAALIKGPWYLDAEVKADILSVAYNSPSVSASTNALSIGVLANTGYRMDNGKSFLEPIASFGFVNTSLGDTTGGGATIDYSNGQSIKVGLGARVGTTFGAAGGNQTEIDLLGKVWDEFGGPNTVTVSDGVNTDTFTDSISGITGEVVGRATIYNADRSASGFVSVGGKFGAGSTNVSAKAGLRKSF